MAKQINNLKIIYSKTYENWRVVSPRGAVIEVFRHEKDAISFAKRTKDLVARR